MHLANQTPTSERRENVEMQILFLPFIFYMINFLLAISS